MLLRYSARLVLAALFLAGLLAGTEVRAQAADPTLPAPEAAPPVATPDQPSAAFNAAPSSSTVTTTTTTTVKKSTHKKKRKKRSHDFKKAHAAKKRAPVNEVDLNAVPGAASGAPIERRGYDPSISEPTEEVMAIKNRAARQYWEGKRPLNGGPAPGEPMPMANPNALERVSASDLSGVTFDDQPLHMPETDAFRHSIDTVAFELGRPCKSHEYLGWPLAQTEQARVDRVFNETITKFRLRGFSIMPHRPRAAGSDISVFTADRTEGGYGRHVLGLWSAGDVGLLLLLCDTDAPADLIAAQHHTAKDLKAKKKKTVRKKAKKKAEEKPHVIPGAAPAPTTELTPPAPEPAAVAPAPEPVAAAPLPTPAAAVPAPTPTLPPPAAVAPPPSSVMIAPAAPAPAATVTTTTVTTTTPAPAAAPPAPTTDTPPPAVKSDAAPPPPAAPKPLPASPPAAATTTPPASPSAAQGKETPSPVEPAKAPEPQGSSSGSVVTMPYNAPAPAPASSGAAPGKGSALIPPAQRGKETGTTDKAPADSSRSFSGAAPAAPAQ